MSTAPTPIELTLKNGEVVKAANAEEALKTLAKMYEDTKDWAKGKIDQTQADLEANKAETARLAQLVEQSRPRTNDGFDKDQYYRLLNEDPMKAQNYVDAYRFGIPDPDQVPKYFQNMNEKITQFDGMTLAGQFLQQHEEFPQGDAEAAKALRNEMEGLTNQGHPFSMETMEMAYRRSVTAGKIKPLEAAAQQDDELPPSLGGSGSVVSDTEVAKAEQMNDADLEKFLREKGVLK